MSKKSRARKAKQAELRREIQRREGQRDRSQGGTRQPPFGPMISATQEVTEQYRGPLPPPRLLREFDEAVPGSAAKILDNWHEESLHRRQLERDESQSARDGLLKQLAYQARGQRSALTVALAGFGVAAYALRLGFPWAAVSIAGANLTGIVSIFVWGGAKRKKRGELTKPPGADPSSTELTAPKPPHESPEK